MVVHLGKSWYLFEIPDHILDWIKKCTVEYTNNFQPYNRIYLKCKNKGKRNIGKLVFAQNSQNEPKFPVCYILDINSSKLRGNRMKYLIPQCPISGSDSDTSSETSSETSSDSVFYCDRFPTFHNSVKFEQDSLFMREKNRIIVPFLNSLRVPQRYTQKQRILSKHHGNIFSKKH